jgi:putative heme-binding domain-containing protein
VRRGLQVFDGTKASCRACHKLGYVGGDLAPELSKIGAIRSRRDLLEAIVFPSASFVRSYEPTQFLLKDGRSINGLVRKETASDILLQTGVNKEERIAKADIESRQTSTVSVMPAGMEQQLSPQELADLLEFLQSMK